MFRSIRNQIAIPYILLILLIIGSTGVYLENFYRRNYLEDLQKNLSAQARLVADEASLVLPVESDLNRLDDLCRKWQSLLGARVTLISPNGTVLGESQEDRTKMDNHANRPEFIQAMKTGEGNSIRFSTSARFQMMYAAQVIRSGDEVIGVARIALPLTRVEQNVNALRLTVFGAMLTASVLAVLVATIIAERTTRPLRALTKEAHRISIGEAQAVHLTFSNDEIGEISRAIRTMALDQQVQIDLLTKERSLLSTILDQMTDGVVVVDQTGHVQMINPAAERMFSISQADAKNRSLAEVLRLYQVIDLWKRCLDTGETQVTLVELGLQKLSLQCVVTPLGASLPGSALILFQDLTRLRQLETIRRDFISNISHELRTPLASLKALTETLQDGALEDPPVAQKFLLQMETEVDALSLMVSELLELSRIESGRVPLQLVATSPQAILESAIERLRLQAERANLTLHLELPDDLPNVLADAPRIEQVIVNLLHNAIKFTPSPGDIWINARKAEQNGKQVIVISVKDTGVGIPEADLPRIFERFYKADRARSGKGTGLGLAIARHLVEAHGGRIWAESKEKEGSTFYFSLPIVEESE